MAKDGKKKGIEVGKLVRETVEKHPEVMHTVPAAELQYRCQSRKYDHNPANYGYSDSRYAHPDRTVGVLYLGFSKEVALAETFQPGQGSDNQAVAASKLEQSSLHRLETTRPLRVVDAGLLANKATHHRLQDLIQAKGEGSEGYKLTQELSAACMDLGRDVDGILYPSSVYAKTGSLEGCNLVLFDGRGPQVKPVDHEAVMDVELPTGKGAVEFLESQGVVVE